MSEISYRFSVIGEARVRKKSEDRNQKSGLKSDARFWRLWHRGRRIENLHQLL